VIFDGVTGNSPGIFIFEPARGQRAQGGQAKEENSLDVNFPLNSPYPIDRAAGWH
jgi:hypothetical protein